MIYSFNMSSKFVILVALVTVMAVGVSEARLSLDNRATIAFREIKEYISTLKAKTDLLFKIEHRVRYTHTSDRMMKHMY